MAQCKQLILKGYIMHKDRGIKNLVIDQYEQWRGEETSNLGIIGVYVVVWVCDLMSLFAKNNGLANKH
jgi:hypothetical protein